MKSTQSEENYVKQIFQLSGDHDEWVNTTHLAEKVNLKPSSVTDMVQKLHQKNLVKYKKYKGVRLSENGKDLALKVIRKHRLWEVFLHKKLLFNWDEVHDIAEQLEHISSTELVKRLDKFLNYPKLDPHGDPIPNESGEFSHSDRRQVSDCREDDKGILVGVNDSSSSFLQFLENRELTLGTLLKIKKYQEFDQSFDIELGRGKKVLNISSEVAFNLFISNDSSND
ncbi:MAG TPA: iron-dependent repressor [Flavobacteriales bacterium]|nr:iron-dependent repressor [Flavobacteriales bacterium]